MSFLRIEKLPMYIRGGIYILMTFPLWYTSRTMYPAHFGKTLLFQIGIEFLLLLLLIFFFKSKRRLFRFGLLVWLLFGFFVSLIIASVCGVDPARSFWGYQSRGQGVFTLLHFFGLYILLRQFFDEQKHWKILSYVIVGIGLLSSFVAWVGPHISLFDGVVIQSARLSGLVTNPIFFAAYLVIPTFFAFILALQERNNKTYLFFLLLSGLFLFFTLMATQVRGAMVAFVFSASVFWFGYLFVETSKKLRVVILSAGILLVCIMTSLYFFNVYSDTLRSHVPAISRALDISPTTGTGQTRLMAWAIAYEGFKDRPLFGWGPENFQDIFDTHYNPRFLEFTLEETIWDKPHNYVIELLATGGVVTIVFYISILVVLFFYLIRLLRHNFDKRQKIVYLIIFATIIFYVGQNLFGIETSYSYQLWFVLLAYIVYEYTTHKERQTRLGENGFYKKIAPVFLIIFIIVVPFLIYRNITMYKASVFMGDARDAALVGDTSLWVSNAKNILDMSTPFLWEQALFLVQDIASLDSSGVLNKDILAEIYKPLNNVFIDYIDRDPQSFQAYLHAGELHTFMAEYVDLSYMQQSNNYLEQARVISPLSQRIIFLLSKNYLLEGKNDDALRLLGELVSQYPDTFEVHWFYGLVLVETGDIVHGLEELEKGSGFGFRHTGNIEFMIDLYAEQKAYEKIIPLYKNLIAADMNNGLLYARLAATYATLGDTDSMIESINKAVEKDPSLRAEAELFLRQQGISL